MPKRRRVVVRQNSNISQQDFKKYFYLNEAYDCWNQHHCKDLQKGNQLLLIMAKKGI